ncbi:MAG: polyphenol oxidase family protein [Desulfovibrio sp.]|nr:polyphenol oxidase family protein [Desulfovibrio sp.]
MSAGPSAANCQPVMLSHKSDKYIAPLHVGWRVPLLPPFPAFGVLPGSTALTPPQGPWTALWAAQLVEAEFFERHIRSLSLDLCTAENSALFFYYRREKVCVRQGNIVWII